MITEKEIEEAFEKNWYGCKQWVSSSYLEKDSFTAGAKFAQSKLLEMANSGFEEAWENSPFSSPDKEYALALWQSRLSLMAKLKEVEEQNARYLTLRQEVLMENEKLKKQVEIAKEALRLYAEYGNDNPDSVYNFEVAQKALAKLEEK